MMPRRMDEELAPEPLPPGDELIGTTTPIVAAGAAGDVAQQIEEIPAAEGADVLESLPPAQAADVAEYLDPDTAGRIFAEMDPTAAASVLTDMEAPEASMVVSAMSPDDRVDVLEHVSDETHDAIIEELEPDDAEEVRQLEQYPPDTAGGIMTTEATALPEDYTVEQALSELRRLSEGFEQHYYAYVIDKRRHLIGVLSIRDLILARPQRRIAEMMRGNVKRVLASTDQEQVARLMRKFNFLAVPVVDDQGRLLGIITIDDIIDVVEEEASEDLQKMFGVGARERMLSPWPLALRKRSGWLLVNLVLLLLASLIVSHFRRLLAEFPLLAIFFVIVAGMGTLASAQGFVVVLRGLAAGESGARLPWRILYRETVVSFVTGCLLGLIATGCAAFLWPALRPRLIDMGSILFLAVLLTQVAGALAGVLFPLLMKRMGADPAQSAFLAISTITNCLAFYTTLSLGELILHRCR